MIIHDNSHKLEPSLANQGIWTPYLYSTILLVDRMKFLKNRNIISSMFFLQCYCGLPFHQEWLGPSRLFLRPHLTFPLCSSHSPAPSICADPWNHPAQFFPKASIHKNFLCPHALSLSLCATNFLTFKSDHTQTSPLISIYYIKKSILYFTLYHIILICCLLILSLISDSTYFHLYWSTLPSVITSPM